MKQLKLLVFMPIFCLIITTGCSTIGKSGKYYGVQTAEKNIVFVIDVSGSMEGKNEGNISDKLRAEATAKAGDTVGSMIGGPLGGLMAKGVKRESTKLASAKRELGPAIRGLDETTSFTIVLFSNSTKYWKKNLVKATSGNKTKASLYVESLESSGGTAALRGLKAAFAIKGADTIFFLSDGFPSDASSGKILKEVKSMNSKEKITIHTVGLGENKDENFLKKLAEDNGGEYKEG